MTLVDIADEPLAKGLKAIERNLERQVSRERISAADKDAALARITTGVGLDKLKDADLVIEAATENEEVKRKILTELCPHLGPDAIIASNTSSISITRLAAATDRPGRFMGMHFMNPVPVMKLVELIRRIVTEPEAFDAVRELTISLAKTPTSGAALPAFTVNRPLLPLRH